MDKAVNGLLNTDRTDCITKSVQSVKKSVVSFLRRPPFYDLNLLLGQPVELVDALVDLGVHLGEARFKAADLVWQCLEFYNQYFLTFGCRRLRSSNCIPQIQ